MYFWLDTVFFLLSNLLYLQRLSKKISIEGHLIEFAIRALIEIRMDMRVFENKYEND